MTITTTNDDSQTLMFRLGALLSYVQQSGIRRISLETGTPDYFAPAWRLYERNGFACCEPFGDYRQDPYSCFMTRAV